MQKKTSNTSLKNTVDTRLSIHFNLDGFSFCISTISSKKDIYFSEYLFNQTQKTPEKLLLKIKEIFNTDSHLQHDFSSVLVIHQNNLSTLVPNKYFEEDKLESYLNYNIKTLATDFIAFDDLKILEAKNIYVPYVNINNYLFQNFGTFDYKHHLSILIEKLINTQKSEEKEMFVNVSNNNFDIVVLQNKKVLLSNSFSFETKEDFIYYILFTAEQLQLNTEEFKLHFIGDIETGSEMYTIVHQYIRNISFLESENTIFNHLDSSKHSNFILLGS
ncbi:hypothetical protein BTO04_04835 [Polaribacter sp. SA4-10]|uniref:DUF3822 family protein n=1 Tax=Polaribacter sp. SA4-10 TaxID=754397 RepID=UPI000B3D20AB|nr:DUF3822 family protein [Polaribacter sp. SA4-10]ARV07987.1 hypothetical protein BTO04_04835 [Polaribacter sp. SA4-10]